MADQPVLKSDFRPIRHPGVFPNVNVVKSALKSWWNLPRAPNNPGVVWWDKWLVTAAALAVVTESIVRSEMPWRPVGIAIGIVLAFALWWRRTHPLLVTFVVFVIVIVSNVLLLVDADWEWEVFSVAFVLIFPYALMRWGSGREQIAGFGLIWLTYALTIPVAQGLDEVIGGGVVLAMPAVIGAEVRAWTGRRARQVEQMRLKERGRLARELHDTVAHHVSAIAIQAQAGRELAKTDPDAALETLSVIESEASRTLQEMRAMVGALRDGDEPELAPARGISDLAGLAESAGATPRVDVEVTVDVSELSPAVNEAVYRLAQESITNAIRHARGATRVDVEVSDVGSSVMLVVEDDGEATVEASDAGYGLIGMEERAKLLGGTFSAGPNAERGWQVTAVLPRNGLAE